MTTVTNEERARIQALIDDLLAGKKTTAPSAVTERIYEDEPILRRASQLQRPQETGGQEPSKIRQMRRLCTKYGFSARLDAGIFCRQARFMADYEDDLPWEGFCELYYPSYESMTDRQLRGYFTWRSWVRAGRLEQAPRGFVRVYCFELLNLIGVASPQEAYTTLQQLQQSYGQDASTYYQIRAWLHDFVIWHGMDRSLLPQTEADDAMRGWAITLLHYRQNSPRDVCEALAMLSSYRLENARFYKLHPDEVSEVVWRVFDQLTEFHEKNRKTSLCEHLIGRQFESPYQMFSAALIDSGQVHPDTVYAVDELDSFVCKDGAWLQRRFFIHSSKSKPAGALLRQIDYCMREAYGFKSTLKPGEVTKAYQSVIDKVIAAFMAEKVQREQAALEAAAAAAQKAVTIDLSKLRGIRSAALETQQKLIVEEDGLDEPAPAETPAPEPHDAAAGDAEVRLLRCLLRGQPYDWVRTEGLLLSVLVDAINERYYEEFADTVLDFDGDRPVLIEDYIDDLKGIIGE